MDNKGYSKTDSSEGIYRPIPKDNAVRDPHSRFVTFHYIVIINLDCSHNHIDTPSKIKKLPSTLIWNYKAYILIESSIAVRVMITRKNKSKYRLLSKNMH